MAGMPRRANLTGSPFQDRWRIRVTLTRVDGSKFRQAVYGKTQREAQENAQKLIYETGRNIQDSFTVNELAAAWEASWKGRDLAPSTVRNYRLQLRLNIKPIFGAMEAASLTVPIVVNGLKRIKAPRMRTATRTVLGTMLAYGRLIGAVKENPLDGLRLPREHKSKRMRVTAEDYEAATQSLDPEIKLFYDFLSVSGLRPWKEAINLTGEQIGYRMDTFFVMVPDSKTENGIRVVPIPGEIGFKLMGRTGRLFPHSESTYKRRWSALGIGSEIYALRRLAITRWCEQDASLDVVRQWAGHADLRTTLEIYNEVQKNRLLTSQGKGSWMKLAELRGEE